METTAIVDIFEISFDGAKGVGKLPEGKVIFVPRTAPGDTVKVRITQNKKTFCQGEVVEILTPSPFRILPKCSIYEECGGCQIQHLQYEAQIAAKQALLQRYIDKVSPQTQLLEFEVSEQIWEYRNRLEAHFKNSQWGFYKRRTHDLVFTNYCHIAKPALNKALNELDLKEGHVHVAEARTSQPSEHTTSFGTTTNKELHSDIPHDNKTDMTTNLNDGPKVLVDYGRKRGLQGVFSQVNEGVNQKLKTAVSELLKALEWDCALDLYAGSGNFSSLIAAISPHRDVHSVELSQNLVQEGQAQLRTFSNIHWHQMPCEKFNFKVLGNQKTLVILDPPRTGCEAQLLTQLTDHSQIHDLIYISCNPPILFRDLKVLSPHFSLMSLQGFDMFPQTMHFEAIAVLKRTN
ncbi:MAG: TRAM domain-containing protein [Bdellovibrionaceae bacterium]|nr:TRAM domain-containing protein [Pseudobdellovibrionaceae bacterium]